VIFTCGMCVQSHREIFTPACKTGRFHSLSLVLSGWLSELNARIGRQNCFNRVR
jgi:hypothetical protein